MNKHFNIAIPRGLTAGSISRRGNLSKRQELVATVKLWRVAKAVAW